MAKFIDVAFPQKNIDWGKVRGEISHAYVRIGFRGSLKKTNPDKYKKLCFDDYWQKNLEGVQKNGIPFSVYFNPTDCTTAEAQESAEWLYGQIKDLALAFPPALDVENVWGTNREAGCANDLSKAERTRLLKIITDYFNERGMNIGIYASASWFSSKIDMSAFPKRVRDCTWVADSTGAVDYNGPYWLHQYGQEYIAGISGKVDVNRVCGSIPSMKITESAPAEVIHIDPVEKMIELADAEVGYHEKRSNSGLYDKTANSGDNNYTKYGKEMHEVQPSNMDFPAAWCDSWFDWLILMLCAFYGYGPDMARQVLCGTFDDYTYNSVAMYKKAGRWTQTAGKGHQIFFGGAGHTGVVTNVDSTYVYTDEGNKSNEVRKCKYRLNDNSIIGYGRPRYDLLGTTIVMPVSTDKDKLDDLHTVKWSGFTKRETKVYTQPDTTSPTCSFSPIAQAEPVGVCKRVGKFYLCKYKDKYGYIHSSHIRK